MSLRIVKPGICTSVQDGGRQGFCALGIAPGGAMDTLAAAITSLVAGNDAAAAVVEMSFPAPVIVFEKPLLAVIGGADFGARLNGQPVDQYKPLPVQPGDLLSFERKNSGAWAYLAIHGGLALEPWLGSCSTHTTAVAGGFKGRLLQKEDIIDCCKPFSNLATGMNWQLAESEWQQWYAPAGTIAVLPGNEFGLLDAASRQQLYEGRFAATADSNRMGYRLTGPALQLAQPVEMISAAVTRGTIQLLPGGSCIVLMAGHQTTGGYPRIAHVTAAAQPALAQLQWVPRLQWKPVCIEDAEESLLSMQQWLRQVAAITKEKYSAAGLL